MLGCSFHYVGKKYAVGLWLSFGYQRGDTFLERDLQPAALAVNVSVDGKSFRVSSWNPIAQGLNSLPDEIGD